MQLLHRVHLRSFKLKFGLNTIAIYYNLKAKTQRRNSKQNVQRHNLNISTGYLLIIVKDNPFPF